MKYVVAVSQKEAESLVAQIGHDSMAEAVKHLREVQAPPTDPHWAQQYRIYKVKEEPFFRQLDRMND